MVFQIYANFSQDSLVNFLIQMRRLQLWISFLQYLAIVKKAVRKTVRNQCVVFEVEFKLDPYGNTHTFYSQVEHIVKDILSTIQIILNPAPWQVPEEATTLG